MPFAGRFNTVAPKASWVTSRVSIVTIKVRHRQPARDGNITLRFDLADGGLFELKYDSFRLLKEGEAVRLLTRNGNDLANRFREITKGVQALEGDLRLMTSWLQPAPHASSSQASVHRSATCKRASRAVMALTSWRGGCL